MTAENVIIVGAGRQGRNVIDVLRLDPTAKPVAGFLDDTKPIGTLVDDAPVLGPFSRMADQGFVKAHRWIVAIGDPKPSFEIFRKLAQSGARFVNAIHPMSVFSSSATVGEGTYVAAFTRIMVGSRVGDGGIFEAGSLIGAEVRVGHGVRMGPGARLLGGAAVGSRTFAGAGSVVLGDICVGDDCQLGANAVVRQDVPNNFNAFGVPAVLSPRG